MSEEEKPTETKTEAPEEAAKEEESTAHFEPVVSVAQGTRDCRRSPYNTNCPHEWLDDGSPVERLVMIYGSHPTFLFLFIDNQ